MLELVVGSKLVTRRPTDPDTDLETLTPSEEYVPSDDEEAMPSRRALTEDVEPYQTPVALTPRPANLKNKEKNKARVASDTDVESSASDIEVIGEPEPEKQSVSQLVSVNSFHMTDTLFLQDSHLSLIDQAEYWPGYTSMYSPV